MLCKSVCKTRELLQSSVLCPREASREIKIEKELSQKICMSDYCLMESN